MTDAPPFDAACQLCHCCLDAPDRHGEILGEWVARAETAEATVEAQARELCSMGSTLEWIQDALDDKPVCDFAESFEIVRRVVELKRAEAELSRLQSRIAELEGR